MLGLCTEFMKQWQREERKNVLAQVASKTTVKGERNRPKTSAIHSGSASASTQRKPAPIFVKLAEESMSSEIDSDSSTYSSLNEHGTG